MPNRAWSVGMRNLVCGLVACAACTSDSVRPEMTPGVPARATLLLRTLEAEVTSVVLVPIGITDSLGRPTPKQRVRFAVTAGGGSVVGEQLVTDGAGQVQQVWALGSVSGVQTLTVTYVDSAGAARELGVLTATARPSAPVTAAAVTRLQSALVADRRYGLMTLGIVQPKDQFGNEVPLVQVAGGGVIIEGNEFTVPAPGRYPLEVSGPGLDTTIMVYAAPDISTANWLLVWRCIELAGFADSATGYRRTTKITYRATPAAGSSLPVDIVNDVTGTTYLKSGAPSSSTTTGATIVFNQSADTLVITGRYKGVWKTDHYETVDPTFCNGYQQKSVTLTRVP